MSLKANLNEKSLVRNLLFYYALTLPLFCIVSFFIHLSYKHSVAEKISETQRNNLYIHDYRSASYALQILREGFHSISYFSESKKNEFSVIELTKPKWFHRKIEFLMFADASKAQASGNLVFYYNWLWSLLYATLIWIVCIIFVYPVFKLQKLQYQQNLEVEKLKIFQMIAKQTAHDIRSPLQALYILADDIKIKNTKQQKLIQTIIGRIIHISEDLLVRSKNPNLEPSTTELTEVHTNTLDFAPTETQQTEATSVKESTDSDFNYVQLVEKLDLLIQEKKLQYKNIQIVFENFLEHEFKFNFQLDYLVRILSNLINNSAEAILKKQTEMQSAESGRLELLILNDYSNLVLRISDNGIGIAPELIDTIGKSEASYNKNSDGPNLDPKNFGIGLYAARKSLESAGGSMKIKSQLHKFTTIELEIPVTET